MTSNQPAPARKVWVVGHQVDNEFGCNAVAVCASKELAERAVAKINRATEPLSDDGSPPIRCDRYVVKEFKLIGEAK